MRASIPGGGPVGQVKEAIAKVVRKGESNGKCILAHLAMGDSSVLITMVERPPAPRTSGASRAPDQQEVVSRDFSRSLARGAGHWRDDGRRPGRAIGQADLEGRFGGVLKQASHDRSTQTAITRRSRLRGNSCQKSCDRNCKAAREVHALRSCWGPAPAYVHTCKSEVETECGRGWKPLVYSRH